MDRQLYSVALYHSRRDARGRTTNHLAQYAVVAETPEEAVQVAWTRLLVRYPTAQPRNGYPHRVVAEPDGVIEVS